MLDRMLGRTLGETLRRSSRIDPRVAEAVIASRRHRFVAWRARHRAYDDLDEPLLVARLLTQARLAPTDRVLELGTGSGFAAAVISRLVGEVVTVEPVPSLLIVARRRLLDRPTIVVTDSLARVAGDFDVIVVRCGDDPAPPVLIERLRPGGRLLGAVGGGIVRVERLGTALVTVRDRSSPA